MDQNPHIEETQGDPSSGRAHSNARSHDGADLSTPMSFGKRVGLLFSSPAALGDEIVERPAWLAPLLLGLVLTLIGTAVIPAQVFVDANRAAMAGSAAEMPDFMTSGSFFKYAALGGITIFWFVINLVTAGLMALVFAFILGDEGKFKQYLTATAWAFVIAGLAALLLSPLRVMTRNPQLTLNLGTFMELVMEGGYPLRLARMLDFFGIWSWAVLGALASRFDRQRSIGSGIAVVVIMMISITAIIAIFIPDT